MSILLLILKYAPIEPVHSYGRHNYVSRKQENKNTKDPHPPPHFEHNSCLLGYMYACAVRRNQKLVCFNNIYSSWVYYSLILSKNKGEKALHLTHAEIMNGSLSTNVTLYILFEKHLLKSIFNCSELVSMWLNFFEQPAGSFM